MGQPANQAFWDKWDTSDAHSMNDSPTCGISGDNAQQRLLDRDPESTLLIRQQQEQQ